MADEDQGFEASPAVEARLRDEVRAIARTRRTRWAGVAALAAAAVLAIAIAIAVPSKRAAEEPGSAASRSGGAETAAAEVATAFFPLIYSGMPVSNAQIVRLEVPRAALASFGLTPIDVPDGGSGTASGTVQADVLVGEDGVARAVRFVRSAGLSAPRSRP